MEKYNKKLYTKYKGNEILKGDLKKKWYYEFMENPGELIICTPEQWKERINKYREMYKEKYGNYPPEEQDEEIICFTNRKMSKVYK